jgi:hypothetical protein
VKASAACTLAIAVVVLASCTTRTSHPSPPPSVYPPSPQVVPSPLTPVSVADERAIEVSLRAFVHVLSEPTSTTSLEAQYQATVGNLHDWLGWRLGEPIAATAPGVAFVRRLHVDGSQGDVAWVDLDATIHFPFGDDTVGGPVQMQRSDTGWKVLDYAWQGASQRAAVFSSAHGSAQSQGVTADVTGVVLQPASIDVFATITNATGDELDLQGSDTVKTQDGFQLVGLTPYADAPVAAHGSLRLDFLLLGRGMPLSTTAFSLGLEVFTNPGFKSVTLTVPVTLQR